MYNTKNKIFFEKNGYLKLENLLNVGHLAYYDKIYDDFINNKHNTIGLRSDLSGEKNGNQELITQIMLPSKILPQLINKPIHSYGLKIAQFLLGNDIILDFDMLINKAPNTNKETPWHQDAAYWIDMPDERALSIWFAIDKSTLDNGCMWYTPSSHLLPLRKHSQPVKGGALQCKGSENESVSVPLEPGSCVIHHGKTLHFSRGNSTTDNRRALILNYRPKAMVELERQKGYDHSGKRKKNK
jgi:ectoine hydroxylase-related dioxygenase (phytanoyl-CoA dioxygenase family)